jgi:hypothetical protein
MARSQSNSTAAPNGPIYIGHVDVINTETGPEAHDRAVVILGDRIADGRAARDSKAVPTLSDQR